jgi:hypothetical protein
VDSALVVVTANNLCPGTMVGGDSRLSESSRRLYVGSRLVREVDMDPPDEGSRLLRILAGGLYKEEMLSKKCVAPSYRRG